MLPLTASLMGFSDNTTVVFTVLIAKGSDMKNDGAGLRLQSVKVLQ